MDGRAEPCIRCHPPGPDDPPLTGTAHYICDRCTDETRNPFLTRRQQSRAQSDAATPDAAPGRRPQTDTPKRKRKRTKKTVAGIAALLFLLPSGLGCTLHRETSLDWGSLHHETTTDFACDPAELVRRPSEPQQEP